jgi:hypothetical protein
MEQPYFVDSVRGAKKFLYLINKCRSTLSGLLHSFKQWLYLDRKQVASKYSGQTYVGWQWQAGQGSTSSNTSGSITSTVSVNTTAGFSVVTYTGKEQVLMLQLVMV